MEVIEHETKKSRFKRKRDGAREAPDGRLSDNRRYKYIFRKYVSAKLKRLFAGTIEQMLEAEMDEHLGYEKNSIAGNNSGNSRNGYGKKTISSDYGECEIAVPRDRNGEFEPKIIEKRQTRTDEIEQKILAMYSKGMSQRDIEDTLREIYGSEISQGLISRITDKILPEVNEWQKRPLEKI